MSNALTYKVSGNGGRKLPVPGGREGGKPGVIPPGTQDPKTPDELASYYRMTNTETGKRPGPEWIKNRLDTAREQQMAQRMKEMGLPQGF